MLGLTARPKPVSSPHDLTARAFTTLDARLCADVDAPVAVAVSGGGDFMALLAIAADWAARRGRRLLALSVDHGLQPDSGRWSRFALDAAGRLGAEGRLLHWVGDKPATGISAAARRARHALLADAAREAGAKVVLMAHTADDIAEGQLMRLEGSNLGQPNEWAPSPAWPQGRGVFLLRPLLAAGRAELRTWLRERAIDWIEDPANDDPKYARSRARVQLAGNTAALIGGGAMRGPHVPACAIAWREVGGGLGLDREAFRAADAAAARGLLGMALLSAAGTARLPRGERLADLAGRLRGAGDVAATLAGARVAASDDEIVIGRDPGRNGLPRLDLEAKTVSVWDGRFEIAVDEPGLAVAAAAGRMARLTPAARKEITALAPILRGSQPVITGRWGTEGEARPVLAAAVARVRALAGPRLRAACGLIAHEREIEAGIVAPEVRSSYVGNSGP